MSRAFTLWEKARAKLLGSHPFWAAFLLQVECIEDPSRATAATDGTCIRYNPAFIESLGTVAKVQFVLAHEMAHIFLLHCVAMATGQYDLDKANRAMDYVINLLLREEKFEVWEDALLDDQYADMNWYQVYLQLPDLPSEEGGGGSGEGEDGEEGTGTPRGGLGNDVLPGPATTDAERHAHTQKVRSMIATAWTAARMAGSGSALLEKLVGAAMQAQVAWYDYLREYLMRITQEEEAWSRRNRRYTHVVLPGRYSEKAGEMVIIGDTSGSITPEDQARVIAESRAVAEQLRPERMRFIWADDGIVSEQVFEEGDVLQPRPKGGGGTDMRKALTYVERYDPKVVILMTDGYTPWPTVPPPYPLIVCCTTEVAVPVGDVVRVSVR